MWRHNDHYYNFLSSCRGITYAKQERLSPTVECMIRNIYSTMWSQSCRHNEESGIYHIFTLTRPSLFLFLCNIEKIRGAKIRIGLLKESHAYTLRVIAKIVLNVMCMYTVSSESITWCILWWDLKRPCEACCGGLWVFTSYRACGWDQSSVEHITGNRAVKITNRLLSLLPGIYALLMYLHI